MKIGYARVSSADQNLDRQTTALTERGAETIFQEKISGKNNERPELEKMMNGLRAGDVVIVTALDRLARSYNGFEEIWQEIQSKEATLEVINMGLTLDHQNSMTRFYLGIMAQVAELERTISKERQREGIDLAVKRGAYTGRRPNLAMHQRIIRMLRANFTGAEIVKTLGVNRSTITSVRKLYGRTDGSYRDAE
jgi:DNA invertase Pin-like site-specific DNA recombinase